MKKEKSQIEIVIERISKTNYSFAKSTDRGIGIVAKILTFRNQSPFAYSEEIRKFDRKKLTFPIGMIKTLTERLADWDVGYTVDDYNYELPEGVTIDSRLSGRYEYQRIAVERFYERRFGIIQIPTRGGKTFIASEIIRIFLQTVSVGNALFVVDSTTLFTQAVSDMKIFFEPYGGIDIGEIRAGHIDTTKRVTVAMIQTLSSVMTRGENSKKSAVRSYMRKLKMLCVDEIHDNFSQARLKIYNTCKDLDYRLCLSATPYRTEESSFVQNLRLMAWSGDIIYICTEDMLIQNGALAEYRVIGLMCEHNLSPQQQDALYNEGYSGVVDRLIVNNRRRNTILVSLIEQLRVNRIRVLVLFSSVEHGEAVSHMTGHTFIHGKTKLADREAAKRDFLNPDTTDGTVLLASGIFKKGVTLPEAEVVINADGGLEGANTVQKKGRILGTTDAKRHSVIVDIFDIYEQYLTEHTAARLQTYVNEPGCDSGKNMIVLDTGDEDWLDDAVTYIKEYLSSNE